MFSFMAETIPSKDQWIKYLAIHLQASCGVREKIFRLSRYSNFWQKFVITPAQMCHIGGHGDILLFRTNNTMANAQRFFTSSEFDHVAMLVQTEDKKIVVLEALGKVGVELNEWEKFIDRGWYKLYERIAYRKLTCKRDARFNQALSNFINDSVGKKYEITFQKLMKMNSLIAGSTYKDAKEYESFFCSELVAAAYKSCGLVSQSKSCSQYWPSSFGDKESIDFLGGAKLEAQVDLVFDL